MENLCGPRHSHHYYTRLVRATIFYLSDLAKRNERQHDQVHLRQLLRCSIQRRLSRQPDDGLVRQRQYETLHILN